MERLPNGELLSDRAVSMAKRIYEGLGQGSWDKALEVDQRSLVLITTQILIDSPERKLLQKVKDYVADPKMVGQFSRFGSASAGMLAHAIKQSFVSEGEDDA